MDKAKELLDELFDLCVKERITFIGSLEKDGKAELQACGDAKGLTMLLLDTAGSVRDGIKEARAEHETKTAKHL